LAGVQAGDMADRSRQGFLSKADAAEALYDYYKFITPNVAPVVQDSMAFTSAERERIAGREEEKAAQKVFTNDSSMGLPAIGVGLLALVTMLGARLWRGLQPATILAGNNMTEMRSQGPAVYAISPSVPATDEAPEGTYLGTPSGPFDPLGTYESSARKAEINNGRLAMVGITSLSGRPAGRKSSTALGVFGKTRASQRKFVPAVSQDELSPGRAVSGICAGLDICIAVDTDGSVYALGNKSPVLGTPMAAGRVSDGLIKDPLTGTSFNVRSGAVEGPWCPNFPFSVLFSVIEPTGLPVFKCKTGGGAVQVEVDVNAKTNFESGYWKGILDAQGKTDGGYY